MEQPNQLAQRIERAGARAWTDDLEAIDGLLAAAGVLEQARAQRRVLAVGLARRGARGGQVLTCLLHHVHAGRTVAWIAAGLLAAPEFIWTLPAAAWASQREVGVVDNRVVGDVAQLVREVAGARASRPA